MAREKRKCTWEKERSYKLSTSEIAREQAPSQDMLKLSEQVLHGLRQSPQISLILTERAPKCDIWFHFHVQTRRERLNTHSGDHSNHYDGWRLSPLCKTHNHEMGISIISSNATKCRHTITDIFVKWHNATLHHKSLLITTAISRAFYFPKHKARIQECFNVKLSMEERSLLSPRTKECNDVTVFPHLKAWNRL